MYRKYTREVVQVNPLGFALGVYFSRVFAVCFYFVMAMVFMSEWLESDHDEENSLPSNVFQPVKKCKLTKTLKLLKPKDSARDFQRLYIQGMTCSSFQGICAYKYFKNTMWAVSAFEA